MAVPPDFTILDLTGKFVLNKTLSDSVDEILQEQGIGYVLRTAIWYATVYLDIKHYKDDDGVEHIDIAQSFTGGIAGTTERRILYWKFRETEDYIFGPVVGRTRRAKAEEIEEEFLTKGWTKDTYEHGFVQTRTESNTPKSGTTWIAHQVWGVEEIDGERRYTRHIHFTGPTGNVLEKRLIYDYLPLDEQEEEE
ncbi:hypothetical protein JOM56_006899 [Amanita muscaria]